MDIRQYLVEKGLCVICFEKACKGDYRCEKHRFHNRTDILDAVLSFELECHLSSGINPTLPQGDDVVCGICGGDHFDFECPGK